MVRGVVGAMIGVILVAHLVYVEAGRLTTTYVLWRSVSRNYRRVEYRLRIGRNTAGTFNSSEG